MQKFINIFHLSYRQRFLRAWLLAMACQTAFLFSQRESFTETPWYDSPENGSYYPSSLNPYLDGDESFFPYNQEQIPALMQPQDGRWPAVSKNEWEDSPSMPDASSFSNSSYQEEPSPYFPSPPNGQWPVISTNEWDDSSPNPAFAPPDSSYAFPYDSEPSFGNQWPVNPPNEWENATLAPDMVPMSSPYLSSDDQIKTLPYPIEQPQTWSFPIENLNDENLEAEAASFPTNESGYPQDLQNDFYENQDLQSDFYENQDLQNGSYENSDCFQMPLEDPTPSTYPTNLIPCQEGDDFSHSEAEKMNFTIFNSSEEPSSNASQYPLTEEGRAKSYSFEPRLSSDSEEKEETPNTEVEAPKPASSLKVEAPRLPVQDNQFFRSSNDRQETPPSLEELQHRYQRSPPSPQPLDAPPPTTVSPKKLESADQPTEDSSRDPKEISIHLNDKSLEALSIELIAQTILNAAKESETERMHSPAKLSAPEKFPEPIVNSQIAQRSPKVITPTTPGAAAAVPATNARSQKEISINFNNVAMIEYIRFISRISNKNFIFDDEDLQFNVTIVSEEPTTVENLMTALLQELKIRDLALMEQGNNIIIHRNPRVRSPGRIVTDGTELESTQESELVTRVFRLNTLDPIKASEIIRPLLSEDALVEVLRDTNNLIITDLVTTVNKIAQLIRTLDAPNSGVTIGQYVVRNAFVASLMELATQILQPIAQGNPFLLVPHSASNSIFIVSNSFIVEKALAILQNLDSNDGRTKILSLETLHPSYTQEGQGVNGSIGRGGQGGGGFGEEGTGGIGGAGGIGGRGPGVGPGQAPYPENLPGSYPFGGLEGGPAAPPLPVEELVREGRFAPIGEPPPPYPFMPGGLAAEGRPSAIFDETRDFLPGSIGAATRWSSELPVGHIERTLFFIYKLRFRRGDQIEIALRKIANSLQLMGTANIDLISAINSSQWIEASNALIFTGTAIALDKVRELILEIDTPLRQVFIEMLILNTSLSDSLTYGVDWIDRFGGGNTVGEEGFIGLSGLAAVAEAALPTVLPVASGFLGPGIGFNGAIIGTHLTHNGTRFNTIGALVRAVHNDAKTDILMNPKIITEDNNTAEIFVGGTDRYKTQSITNELGTLVTNNFQFIDVGTTLRVTPLIGSNGIITLDIIQETTNADASANTTPNQQVVDVNLVPVLTKTRTVTKVHVPDGFFVVLSGMIQDTEIRSTSRIPCLGGIPVIGAFGKSQTTLDNKTNLMIFIRPLIINNSEEYEDVTRRQQDVYREKQKFRRSWNYEIDEALNFGNIKFTDRDEIGCFER